MKKIIRTIMIAKFVPSIVFCEVISKYNKGVDGVRAQIYYQDDKEVAREILGNHNEIIKVIGKIPDGIVRIYGNDTKVFWLFNKKGPLFEENSFKNSKREGICKQYHKNGKIRREIHYKNGKEEGIEKTYYENGILNKEATFKNGKIVGVKNIYYENGKLEHEYNFKEGKPEGIAKKYYPSGKLWSEEIYKNGRRNGLLKVYYENGNLGAEVICRNSYAINIKKYDEKGKLVKEYKNIHSIIK